MNERLTVKRLKSLLTYDANTGRFEWKETRYRKKKGVEAGFNTPHGRYIKIDGERYKAAVLAMFWINRGWFHPEKRVYHLNGNYFDTRELNLSYEKELHGITDMRPLDQGIKYQDLIEYEDQRRNTQTFFERVCNWIGLNAR